MRHHGFSLIELVVVVIILGVIAGIAVPRFGGMIDRSRVQGAVAAVNAGRGAVEDYRALNGSPPASLAASSFHSDKLPTNPYAFSNPTAIEVVSAGAGVTEPATKTVAGETAFWYNADNGEFRARVKDQGTPAATLRLYNTVNSTGVTLLSDTN